MNGEDGGRKGDGGTRRESLTGRCPPPTAFRLILRTLGCYWRSNLAVALGVAVGAAVLTGAMLVGDSMRGSLRHLALDRLGRIDSALVTNHLFRAALADELAAEPGFSATFEAAAPAILLRASLERPDPQSPTRASRVDLIGCDQRFWQLGSVAPKKVPSPREIVLNQPLAEQLRAQVGDSVLLRLPRLSGIPGDSPLGDKRETVLTQRLTVSEIVPAEGLGRFGLRPTQHLAQNAYVPLQWLAKQLGHEGGANTILVAGSADKTVVEPSASPSRLQAMLHPTPADYGLTIERSPRGCVNITSDRMLLPPGEEAEIIRTLRDRKKDTLEHEAIQPVLTYLANAIVVGDREVPYSTVTSLDFTTDPPLGPFVSVEGKPLPPLGPNEIALNTWAADNLHAKVGDFVRIAYFEPESIDGQIRGKSAEFRMAAVVRLSDAADDRLLTPRVKGITDELTMANWDPPFPFDAQRIRRTDEDYWRRYGPTPKAFVSLETGRKLWGSRFGQSTSIRIGEGGEPLQWSQAEIGKQWTLNPIAMGFVVQPVRSQALTAAAGTTPFGVLFVSFSFFVIAAAAMLVALLFRLGVEQRAGQIGTLLAIGWSRRQVGRVLLGEGLIVAGMGSALGVPFGIGYAALMLLGLQTWWLAAVVTPFLRLYVTPASLLVGGLSGLAIAMLVIGLSVRRISRISLRRLMAGRASQDILSAGGPQRHTSRRRWLELGLVLLAVAPAAGLLIVRFPDDVQAGAFFAVGATSLIAMLTLVRLRLQAGQTGPAVAVGRGNVARMAFRNAARNPGRSTLAVALTAAATFLIVAVSAFRVDPSQQTPRFESGNGGFALVAESDQPIFHDLNSIEGRDALGFETGDADILAGSKIFGLRVRSGDDASCLNLYQPRQPTMLGVPAQFIERGGFAWANKPHGCNNPWALLNDTLQQDADGIARVPVILEKNTANYALHLWGGLGETFEVANGNGGRLRLQVVALLADSIFQGDLLIGEKVFLKQFPQISGFRFFLVETPPGRTDAVRQTLSRNLGDYGFTAETTGQRLATFLTVQNTYLSTFQSLGGLGLFLGTFGLAAVQLRNVFERRGELAVLRAAGFQRRTLAWLVLLENAALLGMGLFIGMAAAVLAVLPQVLGRGASIPWASLAATLAAVFLTGLVAGGLAVRSAVRVPVLDAVRRVS